MDIFSVSIIFFLLLSKSSNASESKRQYVFNVLNYGAVGDGKTDDSQAFMKAWNALIEADSDTTVFEIPRNKVFMLQPVIFEGPCKSRTTHVSILGDIVAPEKPIWKRDKNNWIQFLQVSGLTVEGQGKIDGRGETWWGSSPFQYEGCRRPTTILFHDCDNLQLKGLTFINSPRNHISISSIKVATISNLHITAPENSPNTDGIDISESTQIQIKDSYIGTGDDCVAINGGSSFINITNVACGPGHGISVGSLGEDRSQDTVEEVYVENCNFTRTMNGVRIKTWPGGSGFAKKITFKNIILESVSNPVIIDQHYCPNGHCKPHDGNVKISEVKYLGVHGSSTKPVAINLNCSKTEPCTDILMKNVKIKSVDPGVRTYATCINAHGVSDSTSPDVPCLT